MAGFGHDDPDRGPLIVAECAIAADATDQPACFLTGKRCGGIAGVSWPGDAIMVSSWLEPFQPAAFGSAFVLLLSGAAAGCS